MKIENLKSLYQSKRKLIIWIMFGLMLTALITFTVTMSIRVGYALEGKVFENWEHLTSTQKNDVLLGMTGAIMTYISLLITIILLVIYLRNGELNKTIFWLMTIASSILFIAIAINIDNSSKVWNQYQGNEMYKTGVQNKGGIVLSFHRLFPSEILFIIISGISSTALLFMSVGELIYSRKSK